MKKGYSLLEVVIIIIVTAIISSVSIGMIIFKENNSSSGISYTELLKDKNVKEFLDVYSEISSSYYENVDKSYLIKGAINGMTSYLDDNYTSYLDEKAADKLIGQLNATYEGIGVTISDNIIINVIKDSPAYKSGIFIGDKIVSINDIDVTNYVGSDISNLIKNAPKEIKLGIERNSEIIIFNNLKREILDVPSVSYKVLPETNIGYMQISIFSNNLANQVQYALDELQKLNIDSLIIDLRNDTGGYLEQAYETAQLFLENNKIVYSLVDKDDKKDIFYDKTDEHFNKEIIVLVNGGTASAAEILASALKDSYGATIIGKTSFGKGKVQHTYSLDNGSLVKYTSSRWLRPNGECIDEVGIKPDYEVDNEVITDENGQTTIADHQLDKAKELLS